MHCISLLSQVYEAMTQILTPAMHWHWNKWQSNKHTWLSKYHTFPFNYTVWNISPPATLHPPPPPPPPTTTPHHHPTPHPTPHTPPRNYCIVLKFEMGTGSWPTESSIKSINDHTSRLLCLVVWIFMILWWYVLSLSVYKCMYIMIRVNHPLSHFFLMSTI